MAKVTDLPKQELLKILEYAPQRFWPPRPTRQNKAVLVEAIDHARFCSVEEGGRLREALGAAWARQRGA